MFAQGQNSNRIGTHSEDSMFDEYTPLKDHVIPVDEEEKQQTTKLRRYKNR